MILTITKCKDRLGLIKWLRSFKSQHDIAMKLQEAIDIVDHLPHVIEDVFCLSDNDKEELNNLCEFTMTKEAYEEFNEDCNINSSPNAAIKEAMIWYDALDDNEKLKADHLINLAIWRSRPAVC